MSEIITPPEPKEWDPEEQITWDELAPSLQDRFKSIDDSINRNMNHFDDIVLNSRITIGFDPPMNPEPNRDLWWDMNYNVLRAYTPNDIKAEELTYSWQFTRAAWYGGSSDDVKDEVIPSPSTQYSRLKNLVWLSNVATNNNYSTEDESPRESLWTCPYSGTYKISDRCSLFEYNSHRTYTHDGGSLTLIVYKQSRGSSSNTEIYRASYDSKLTYQAQNTETKLYPEKEIKLATGDKIIIQANTTRNPQSTDDIEIYQIASLVIMRKNY